MQQLLIDHMCHPNEQFGIFLPNRRECGITSEQCLQLIGGQNQYLDNIKQIWVKDCNAHLLNIISEDNNGNVICGPLTDILLNHQSQQPGGDTLFQQIEVVGNPTTIRALLHCLCANVVCFNLVPMQNANALHSQEMGKLTAQHQTVQNNLSCIPEPELYTKFEAVH